MRFYKIQIDGLWLTETGEETGNPCKLTVSQVEDLLTPIAGNVEVSADGTPHFQLIEFSAGKVFEIIIETLLEDVWSNLVELILDSLENDTSLTVSGTGDVGDFEVSVKPFPNKPYSASGFINSRIKQVTLRFITT